MKENSIKNERSSIEEYVKILERFSNENVIYGSMVGMTLEKYAMVFIKSSLINKERLFVNENLKDCLPETNKRKKEKH